MADNHNRTTDPAVEHADNRAGINQVDQANGNHATNANMGETVGTVGGAAAGAAVGSIFGPLGTVVGGIAGGVMGNKVGDRVDGNGQNERNKDQSVKDTEWS